MKNKNFSAALINRPLALGVSSALMVMLASCGGGHGDSNSLSSNATNESPQQEAYEVPEDDPTPAPLNIVPVPETGLLAKQSVQEQAQALAVVAADSEAHLKGQFGPMHKWPTMPIAMAVLPDGRVLAYGSNEKGQQNAKLYYVVWDPKLGTGADAFLKLPNTTDTDIFCTGQALLPSTGGVLIFGGDLTVSGKRNYADNDMTIFDPATTKLTSADDTGKALPKMNFKRWYASGISLPNGEYVALGGRNDMERKDIIPNNPATYSPTPELRLANGTWRKLTTATSDLAYGATNRSWFYPRAWAHPKGGVFIIAHQGQMFNLNTSGTGALNQYSGKLIPSAPSRPSVMFAPGRILTLRGSKVANVIDINNVAPVVSSAGTLAKDRQFANATVLADGRVWVNGGSSTGNDLVGKALDSEIWDPKTNKWTTAASATQARLYHSASILLPDGRVLTGGGGANGPEIHMDGEIYSPPYLFKKDGSGQLADRPTITQAPTTALGWNQEFSITANQNIVRVTLVHAGVTTHAFNNEARFIDLGTVAASNNITIKSPASATIAPPGFYLLFAWNAAGVPSVAKIVKLG